MMTHRKQPSRIRQARALWLLLALLSLATCAPAAWSERLESEHFAIQYDDHRVNDAQAQQARDEAERGWRKCARVFPSAPAQKITLDLSPDFLGATGFARPGDAQHPPLIGVRYADMEYLGLGSEFVLTHETAHVFSGRLAGGPLGEGIADWATGAFEGIPMAPWWGTALKKAGLWVDPDALFVTGDYPASREVDARTRTANYTEAAMLVRFLVDRFGYEKFAGFAERYRQVRGSLASNDSLSGRGARRPDPDQVRRVFEDRFAESWDSLRDRWEAQMAADAALAGQAERLVLGEEIYGSIRNYEMWLLQRRVTVRAEDREAVRRDFTEANRSLAKGDLKAAAEHLQEAKARVEQLKRPAAVALR